MTINGGQPHRVGYAGQTHRIEVTDALSGQVYRIGWMNLTDDAATERLLRGLEANPGWSDARLVEVVNRETGE